MCRLVSESRIVLAINAYAYIQMFVRIKLNKNDSSNTECKHQIARILLSFCKLDISRHKLITQCLHRSKLFCQQGVNQQKHQMSC